MGITPNRGSVFAQACIAVLVSLLIAGPVWAGSQLGLPIPEGARDLGNEPNEARFPLLQEFSGAQTLQGRATAGPGVGLPSSTEGPFPAQVVTVGTAVPSSDLRPSPLQQRFTTPNVRVTSSPSREGNPSIASDATGILYSAYEHDSGASRDIRIARSTDGGQTWEVATVTAASYNETMPELLWTPPNTLTMFYVQDDPTPPGPATFEYLQSTDGGANWLRVILDTTGIGQNFSEPSGFPFGAGAYVAWEFTCTFSGFCPPEGSRQTMYLSNADVTDPNAWFILLIFVGDQTEELFRPEIAANSQWMFGSVEVESTTFGAPPGTFVDFVFRIDPLVGPSSIQFVTICALTCPSEDPLNAFLWASGNQIVYGASFRNETELLTPNHRLIAIQSDVGGGASANWSLVNGDGTVDVTDEDQNRGAVQGSGTAWYLAWRGGTDVKFAASGDGGATFSLPTGVSRVNDNTPGTAADERNAIDMFLSGRVGIVWADERSGSNDVFYAAFQSEVTVRTRPADLQVIVDGGTPMATPASMWFDEGSTHILEAITPQNPTADTAYIFVNWTGGPTTPQYTVVISGPAVYEANYRVQHRVRVAASPVGPGVHADGIQYTAATDFWWDAGSLHTIDAGGQPQPAGTGTRYVFVQWSDGETSPSRIVTVSSPMTFTAEYTLQFQLTIDSAFGNPVCGDAAEADGCWYNSGSTARVSVTSPFPAADGRYVFTGWIGDANGTSTTITIVMDAPKSVQALWRRLTFVEEYGWLLALIAAVVVGILLVLYFLRKRRRPTPAPPAAPPPAVTAEAPPPAAPAEVPPAPAPPPSPPEEPPTSPKPPDIDEL